jgi:hypothetical protein
MPLGCSHVYSSIIFMFVWSSEVTLCLRHAWDHQGEMWIATYSNSIGIYNNLCVLDDAHQLGNSNEDHQSQKK